MQAIATINQASNEPAIAPKPARTKRVPKRIAQLVDLLVSGECRTQTAACERLKLDRSYACKMLKAPHVIALIEQQTRVALARSQAPAAATLFRLLDQASSEHVQKDVAIHLLGIAGHKPAANTQVSVSVDIKAGYVIRLREPGDRAKTVDSHAFPTDARNEPE